MGFSFSIYLYFPLHAPQNFLFYVVVLKVTFWFMEGPKFSIFYTFLQVPRFYHYSLSFLASLIFKFLLQLQLFFNSSPGFFHFQNLLFLFNRFQSFS